MTTDVDHETRWAAVDDYVESTVAGSDAALRTARERADAEGLPAIDVTAAQGKFLHLLARMVHARTVLELGTLAGYSTIWLARALPADGSLVSLELEQRFADVARANLDGADIGDRVEIIVGPALETLPTLADDTRAPFDLVFVDADKAAMPTYLDHALQLTRVGSVLVFDNVVRDGRLADTADAGDDIRGARTLHERIAAEPRLEATTIQTVGAKGHDGFTLALVVG